MKKKRNKRELIVSIISLVVFFVIWQMATRFNQTYGWFNPKFLPAPTDIIITAVDYVSDGTLALHATVSIRRILTGFLIGGCLSVVVGIIFVNNKLIEAWFSPIINLLGPVPPYALLPIIIIWFGIGESSKVGLIVYCTFMTMLPYITDGLKNTPPVLVRAATSLGASQWDIFSKVMIPNAIPNIFVGMKVTLAMSFGALLVSEMLGASQGLGYMIINAKQWFKMDDMFLAIIMIGLIYIILFAIIQFIERLILKWKTDVTNAIEK